MEHTPGPWAVENQDQHIEVWASTLRIARIGIYADNSCEANARLVAAAPELLSTLEAILEWDDSTQGLIPSVVFDPARDAIKEAKGN